MTEVIRISDKIFLVKEIVDDFNTENSIVYISYNTENLTRSFSSNEENWEETSKNFPIEKLELDSKLLKIRDNIDELEEERDNANYSHYNW